MPPMTTAPMQPPSASGRPRTAVNAIIDGNRAIFPRAMFPPGQQYPAANSATFARTRHLPWPTAALIRPLLRSSPESLGSALPAKLRAATSLVRPPHTRQMAGWAQRLDEHHVE